MTHIVKNIKDIIVNFHGSLSMDKVYSNEIDDDLIDIYTKVYGDLNMSHPIEDKINLHNDVLRVKKDFKKAVKSYKEEVTNG